jgi:hypothetical protein
VSIPSEFTNVPCLTLIGLLIASGLPAQTRAPASYAPGGRVLVDAHNAYPEDGRHQDRIARALGTGVPVAIEQDLAWCRTGTGTFDVVVAHDTACRGNEPTLRHYFFDAVAPIVDAAIANGDKSQWPIITLNLDFKMDPPELHRAVWQLLGEYRAWLTTAPRTAIPATLAPLDVGPVLVLTGQADAQEVSFHDDIPVGDRLRAFGAVHDAIPSTGAASDETPRPMPATNYRRWWNHPWKVVEREGQPAAGAWTPPDNARLTAIVRTAHAAGLWIRFYTLNGVGASEGEAQNWSPGYNFGSGEAVELRWRAARDAGVDFIATDQYERLAAVLHRPRGRP